jgi:hypothetical protein
MAAITVIIHGWSDCSDSFAQLKRFLQASGVGGVKEILYADYESREDHITYNDVIDGLNDQFIAHGIIDPDGKKRVDLNVIVHSTGGLVIRQWIHHYYIASGDRIRDCPVKRIVMLAPANFGSPLAHRGKSFLGSLFKGRWKLGDLLEVGRRLLDGLELASPHQWLLAHRDLLVDRPYYNAKQVQLTILVGVQDYAGLRGWVNKPGTDGTVVIAGTSLDTAKLVLDFSKEKEVPSDGYTPFRWEQTNPPDEFGFAALEGLDHGSIISDAAGGRTGHLVLKALRANTEKQFKDLCAELAEVTRATYAASGKDKFQQFIVHAADEFGVAIPDFTMEFFLLAAKKTAEWLVTRHAVSGKESFWSDLINRQLLSEVHTHSVDSSYRRLLVNLKQVKDTLARAEYDLGQPIVLSMKLYVPDVDRGIRYDVKSLQNIVLLDTTPATGKKTFSLFFENTTTLMEMRVNRRCEYVTVSPNPRRH